jgi:uncharacterized membrane protein HdeD (DUF308 family)
MVGYQNLKNLNKEVLERFEKSSKLVGVIFLLFGLIGIFYPTLMSLTTAYFVAWLFIFSGILIGYHTIKNDKKDWLGWLKAFIYILTGVLVTIYPVSGVAALGIILAIHFFMDGFASIALAFQLKGEKRWWLILLNGILSLILGVIFLTGWPFSSLVYVGMYVGISLFFNGIVLLSMGSAVKELEKVAKEEDSSKESTQNS